MNRFLLVLNVCLALFLGFKLWSGDAIAGELPPDPDGAWSASDVRLLQVRGRSASLIASHSVTFDLGHPLAEDADLDELGRALRMEPEFDFAVERRSPSEFVLHTAGYLPRARQFTLHLAEPLTAADGAVLEPGPLLSFATPPVSLRELMLLDDPAEDHVELVFDFDLPVTDVELREHLELRDAATDEKLEFEVESRPWSLREMLHVTPRLAEDVTALKVLIPAGLRSRGAELATSEAVERIVELLGPLAITEVELDDDLVDVRFNRALQLPPDVDIEALSEWFSVEPERPLQASVWRGGLRLRGDFAPGDVVGVRLHEGFPGFGRRTLPRDSRRSMLVPDRRADVDFAQRGNLLSARARPELRLTTVNVAALNITVHRVYPNNVVRMLQRGDGASMAPALERRIEVTGVRNAETETVLDLRELLGTEAPRGLWQLEVRSDQDRWTRAKRLLQITDLGVTVRTAGGSAAIQVVSIADGTPVAGADLQVVSPTNQTLATGQTNAAGTALLRWPADDVDRQAFLVHVHHGDDEAFVDRDGHAVELTDPTLGGRRFTGTAPEAWVWPSRGVVRPGGHLDVTVLVRDAAGRAVVGRDLQVNLLRPDGRIWELQRHATPGSGLLAVGFDVDLDAPLGGWRVEVRQPDGTRLGQAAFQVDAFVPLRLEAEVESAGPLRVGQPAEVTVTARWLDGSPAADRPVQLRTLLEVGDFAPHARSGSDAAGNDAGTTDTTDFSFARDGELPFGELEPVSTQLDAEGKATIRLQLPSRVDAQVLRARVLAEVIDPSGREVRAAVSVPVLRDDFHLGVRADAAAIEVCTVDAAGGPVTPPDAIELRLEHRRWNWAYRNLDGYRWRWVTTVDREVLEEWRLEPATGRASQSVEYPQVDGWLVVVARCGDREVEQTVGRRPDRPDRLRVRGPQAPVAPGEVARLEVTAPAAGRGFVTLEGPELLATHVVDLQQGDNVVELPLAASLRLPNVHAIVTLTRPAREVRAGEGPAWLAGGAAIRLRRDDLAGALTLTVPDEVRPEATVDCAITAPGASSAVVAMVDEGVLGITGHASPDPLAWFLARRRLAGTGFDGFTDLIEEAQFIAGTKTGGDGDEALLSGLALGAISPRIRPLVRFAVVPLDADGRGTTRFDLPEYDGRLRVMAIAAGPQQLAAANASTVVRAPLTVRLAAPRMVAPGDRFALPLTLRNDTGSAGTVDIRVDISGSLELAEALPAGVALDQGAERTLHVELRALDSHPGADPADTALTVSARLGAESRELRQEVHVRTLQVHREELLGLALDAPRRVVIGADWDASDLRATLRVDAGPDVQLRPALEALLQYPYGCVEQTTSRGFALLACAALLPRIYGEESSPPDADQLVQAAVDRLVGLQQARGSFGWWPGAWREYEFGTLYAVDFLTSAADRSYDVPAATLQAGLERVRRIAEHSDDISLRCYACEIQSRAGRPARGLLEWLATQARWDEDRTLLAIALQRLGDRATAVRILNDRAAVPESAQQYGNLRSPLRAAALRVRAHLAIWPGDDSLPGQVAALQRLVLDAGRHTTQDLGQALRALSAYYSVHRNDRPTRLVGRLDGTPLPEATAGLLELELRPGSVLELDGDGAGFALLELHGRRPPAAAPWLVEAPAAMATVEASTSAPSDDPPKPVTLRPRLTLSRSYHDLATGEEVTRLRHGHAYEVRLRGSASAQMFNLVIADLLPGGVEPTTLAPGFEVHRDGGGHQPVQAHVEQRDDRVLLFPDQSVRGRFVVSHFVRATMPGRYALPPAIAEAMYDPSSSCMASGPDGLEVRE